MYEVVGEQPGGCIEAVQYGTDDAGASVGFWETARRCAVTYLFHSDGDKIRTLRACFNRSTV